MSNISGSTQTQDLITLITNLQTIVGNVQSSFTNVNNNINAINTFDTTTTSQIQNV